MLKTIVPTLLSLHFSPIISKHRTGAPLAPKAPDTPKTLASRRAEGTLFFQRLGSDSFVACALKVPELFATVGLFVGYHIASLLTVRFPQMLRFEIAQMFD